MRSTMRGVACAAFLSLSLLGAGCSGDGGSDGGGGSQPYRLGLLTTTEGPFASNAKLMQQGVEYAVGKLNDAGGIGGHEVELVTVDTHNNPQNTVTIVTEQATKDRVHAIVGPVDSAGCEIACAAANKLKVPIVSPGAGRPGVLAGARPYGFSMVQPDAANSEPVLKKILASERARTAAIIYDEANATTKAQQQLFAKVFEESGVRVVKSATFSSGDASFAAQVTSIAGARPDVLALAAGPDDAGRIAVEARSQKMTAKLLGTGSLQSGGAAYVKAAGEAAEGTLAAAQFDPHNTEPTAKKLLEQAQKDTGQPEVALNFAYAFDAVNIIAKVIGETKLGPDAGEVAKVREAVMKGLTDLQNYQGMSGATSLGEDGYSIRPELVSRVEGGRFVIVRDGS